MKTGKWYTEFLKLEIKMNLLNYIEEHPIPFKLPKKDGYVIVWNEKLHGFDISIPNGKLFYSENFFNKRDKTKQDVVKYFLENTSNDWEQINWKNIKEEVLNKMNFKNIKWQHDKLKIYGKENYLPRYSAWYGDSDKPYTYSGLTLEPNPWNEGLLHIKHKIEKLVNTKFNSVLLNWYRDGEDYMGWHTDAEKELGKNPIIASVNFGATRRFLLRRKDDESIKVEFPLKHGTLLIMKGELQHFWKHAVPKELKVKEHRFNLTFRVIH